jgi:hypothetical protein
MHYQLRWLYLVIINLTLLAISYICDIQPKLQQLSELRHAEKKLIKNLSFASSLAEKSQNIKNVTSISKKSEWEKIQVLITRMHANGLMIREISASERAMNWVVEGNLQQWYLFILSLETLNHLIHVRDFSCKLNEKNNLVFIMDILQSREYIYPLSKQRMSKQRKKPNALQYSFCPPEGMPYSLSQSDNVSVSIQQMKMVGYLHNSQRTQALVLLPNKMMLKVAQGEHLGREHAVITEIYKDKMIAKLSDGTHVVLMSS